MAIKKQRSDGKGSLKLLQRLINEKDNQDLINKKLIESLTRLKGRNIEWKSPLKKDDYAEYTDDDFIEILELDPKEINLKDFWPSRGANWDGLATTGKKEIILVEAKANIPELVSSPSGAGKVSIEQISKSLKTTKAYLNKTNDVDWTGKFYQYTNRVAHLYFLRELKGKKAFLVNIYFVGDKSVNGPDSVDEWKGAIEVMNLYLGLNSHKLKKYMTDVFINVADIK